MKKTDGINIDAVETMGNTGFRVHLIEKEQDLTADIIVFITKYDQAFYPPISSRTSIESYIGTLLAMDGRLIVCRDREEVAGIAGICLDHPQWKFTYQYVLVDEAYRRMGIPGMLLDTAYSLFKAHGATRIVSRTWSENNASIRHFRKYGFIHFDTVMNDRGAGIHSCYFTKVLQPVVLRNEVSLLGILGGMGTFATGNFLRTLSAIPHNISQEQDMFSYVAVNAATIPDRLTSIHEERTDELVKSMNNALSIIDQSRLSHLLVLCFTVHPFIKQLSLHPGVELINLVDFCNSLLTPLPGRCLLVAAKGTYLMNLFPDTTLVYPSPEHTDRIHQIIFEIKKGIDPSFYKNEIAVIVQHHQCDKVLLGCTELHGMFGFDLQYNNIQVIDPLTELIFHLEHARRNNRSSSL